MKTNSKTQAGVKVAAGIKGGALSPNHNRLLAMLSVKSGIKSGALSPNHNRRPGVLAVKSGIKAGEGILSSNSNRRLT
jgi:hypothetical protein